MANTIKLKKSSVAAKIPLASDLDYGELAINYNDGNLFFKDSSNTIQTIASTQFANVTGNVTGGNIVTAGQVSAAGNVTGGNITTAGRVTATGNVTAGNVTTAGSTQTDILISREQRFTTSNMLKFNQVYTGNDTGSYFDPNEYQKIVTIIPNGNSQNYQILGRITVQSGDSVHTITFNAALRSNTLPDLAWTIFYDEEYNVGRFIDPQLWTKETTTAGFIFAFKVLATIYGTVTVDFDIIPRQSTLLSNITVNTTIASEQASVDAGYTANDMVRVLSALGNSVTAQGSFEAASVSTAGNVTGGNIVTGGAASATGNVTGGNIVTGGAVSATGNVTGGNIVTAGLGDFAGNLVFGSESTTRNSGFLGYGSDAQGFTSEFNNAVFLRNEQGTNEQTLFLGDTGSANGATLFGISTGNGDVRLTLSGLGNLTVPNVTPTGQVVATGNVTGGNIITGGAVSATGNIEGGNLAGTSITGTLVTAAQTNITSVGTLTDLEVAAANLSVGIEDTSASTSANKTLKIKNGARELHVSANTGAGSYNSLVSVNDLSMVASGASQGNANLTLTTWSSGTSGIKISTASNVATILLAAATINNTGNVFSTGNVTGANLVANALLQSNTAVVNTQLTAGNPSVYDSQGNIVARGSGRNLLILQTPDNNLDRGLAFRNGAGAYAGAIWLENSTQGVNLGNLVLGVSSGTHTSVDSVEDRMVLSPDGNVQMLGNLLVDDAAVVTGNVSGGNVITAGQVSATGNVSGGNVTTAGQVSATGNVTGGNLNTGASVVATGNITAGNIIAANLIQAGTTISAAGNVRGGNINSDGLVSATGDVIGADFSVTSNVAYNSGTGNTITSYMLDTGGGTLSWEGVNGQLFSVVDSFSGTIFSVNDISGIPSIEVLDTGVIKLAEYGGNVLIGTGTDSGGKLQITGDVAITANLAVDTNVLYVDTVDNRVGVGTATPDFPLDVNGNFRFRPTGNGTILGSNSAQNGLDGAFLMVQSSAANIDVGVQLRGGTAGTSDWSIYQKGTDNSLRIRADDTSEPLVVTAVGNVGIKTSSPSYDLEVNGSFAATTKSFVIPHPTKKGRRLRYSSLEGPENGVYIRGSTTGKTITLPSYWKKLVDPESITVNLTAKGESQELYVERIEHNRIYVKNARGGHTDYFYTVFAERADVAKLEVEV